MTAYKKAQRFQIKPIFIQVKDLYNTSLYHCFRFYRCGHITYNQALTSKYEGQGVNPLTIEDHAGWTPGVKELPNHLQPASYEYKWKRITRKNFLRKSTLEMAIAEFEKERTNRIYEAKMLFWEQRENEIVDARIAHTNAISDQVYALNMKCTDMEYDLTMIYYQVSHEAFQAWNTMHEAYNAAEWKEIKELETSTIGLRSLSNSSTWEQRTAYREGKLLIAKKRWEWLKRQHRELRFEIADGAVISA